MTRQAPTNTTDQDDNKAKAFFATALTIGAGFAGLAVAGIVLGFDYLLHGEPDEQERLKKQRDQRQRDRYADALAWLENDRAERERFRQRRREWFAEDPESRGEAPSSGESFGRVLGRLWNNLLVGARRFKNGWRTGRDGARDRRDAGDPNWWRNPGGGGQDAGPTAEPTAEPAPTANPEPDARGPRPTPQPSKDDVIDAEIIPDPEPSTRDVVPVGQDEPRRIDETVDAYRRRLADLEAEVQQNHNEQPALN